MRNRWLWLLALTVVAAGAETVFEDGFETLNLDRWKKDVRGGEGSIEVVDGGVHGKCLKITSQGASAYLTIQLDPEKFRGSTLIMSGMVRLDNCQQGEQVWATPKFHFAYRTAGSQETVNAAERWTGSFDWTAKQLKVDVPDDCNSLVMDIGNQNGTGTFYVDDFKLEDTFGTGRPISLLEVCNTGRSDGVAGDGRGSFLDTGPLDLHFLPEGTLEGPGASFYLPKPGDNGGQVMIALKGRDRPELPAETKPVPVGKKVGSLIFLHAAAWAKVDDKEPCYSVVVTYADGQTATIDMVAGVDLANFDAPGELPNWKPAWTGPCAAGTTVGAGLTTWQNPRPEVQVRNVRFVSAGNGVPLVLALTYLPVRGR